MLIIMRANSSAQTKPLIIDQGQTKLYFYVCCSLNQKPYNK